MVLIDFVSTQCLINWALLTSTRLHLQGNDDAWRMYLTKFTYILLRSAVNFQHDSPHP